VYKSKEQYQKLLEEHVAQFSSQQQLLLRNQPPCCPADLSGAIRHVMSGVNPQGSQVFNFKHPSAEAPVMGHGEDRRNIGYGSRSVQDSRIQAGIEA
jgi:hypothetical protein